MENFDLIVVGGGKAGKSLAMNRAKKGWKVALIERQFARTQGRYRLGNGCRTREILRCARNRFHAWKRSSFGRAQR